MVSWLLTVLTNFPSGPMISETTPQFDRRRILVFHRSLDAQFGFGCRALISLRHRGNHISAIVGHVHQRHRMIINMTINPGPLIPPSFAFARIDSHNDHVIFAAAGFAGDIKMKTVYPLE